MKNRLKSLVSVLLALMLCVAAAAPAVFAAETAPVSAPVKVVVELEGVPLPEPAEKYSFALKADDSAFPMPEGSRDGVYTVSVEGAGTAEFPSVSYDKLGIYTYTISQLPGENKDCKYDETVYRMTVFVTNAENGDGFEATTVLYNADKTEKLDEARFKNIYPVVTKELSVKKVWSGEGDHPDLVKVELRNGDKAVETITLTAENDWTHTWKELDYYGDWKAVEIDVPSGYTASYSEENGVTVITNTASLIQTGQLNWPIPVLVICGLAFMLIGGMMIFRKKKTNHG